MDGICTLANDNVYDQLVALLNSIEVNVGIDIPVCVYPFNDNISKITAEIARRPNVQLFDNQASMERWDDFFRRVWDTNPQAKERWRQLGCEGYYRFGIHRRFCAFDGPFDRFIYMDGDTLAMGPFTQVFEQLNHHDWVIYDFQFTDPAHVYEVSSPKLTQVFPQERIDQEIFCSGFYGTKKNVFSPEQLEWAIEQLQNGEGEILYAMSSDQPILNYLVMKTGISAVNLSHVLPQQEVTGCCVTSPHFQARDAILFDQGKRLTYIHYIGIKSSVFKQLCEGENITFPYRDVFLHYRYLHEPEKQPKFTTKPRPYKQPPPNLATKVLKKLGLSR